MLRAIAHGRTCHLLHTLQALSSVAVCGGGGLAHRHCRALPCRAVVAVQAGGLGGPADAVPLGGQRPKRISVIDPATGQLVWVDAAAAKTPLAGIVTSLMGSMGSRGSMSGGAAGMDGMEPASFHGGAAVAGEIMHAQQVLIHSIVSAATAEETRCRVARLSAPCHALRTRMRIRPLRSTRGDCTTGRAQAARPGGAHGRSSS